MAGIFAGYDRVIIDASFFLISDAVPDLLEDFRESSLWVAGTFREEVMSYKQLLNGERKSAFVEFSERLIQETQIHVLNFQDRDAPMDTWEMIREFSARKSERRFAVATGNRLLIEKIILSDAPTIDADIFDLSSNRWILCGDFPYLRDSVEFHTEEVQEIPQWKNEDIRDETNLFRRDGSIVTLRKPNDNQKGGGAESVMFWAFDSDSDEKRMAKIFKPGRLSGEKCLHLQRMIEACKNIDAPWVLFPTDILSQDQHGSRPVGILERYADNCSPLYNRDMYRGKALSSLSPKELQTKLSDTLRLCLNIVRQVSFLNHYGFFISDYNLRNFALSEKDPEHALMFDSDSFGYGNFFGNIFAGNSTLRHYHTERKLEAFDFCDDALYVAIFSLLSLGDAPIFHDHQRNTRTFRYDNRKYKFFYRKYLFPPRLWAVFESAFHEKTVFSVPMLLWTLSESLKELERNPARDFTYQDRLGELAEEADDPLPPRLPDRKGPKEKGIWKRLLSGKYDRILLAFAGIAAAGLVVLFLLYGFSQ